MNSKTKIFAAIALSAGFLFGGSNAVSAQENKEAKTTQQTVKVSEREEKAIKKIEKAATIDEKMQLIAAFIKEFPQSPARSQIVNYAASQISQLKDDAQIIQKSETYLTIFNQPEDADLVYPNMIYSYIQLKRAKDAFDTAQKYFPRHSDDVRSRLVLAVEGSNQVRLGNKDFAAPAREYAATVIELVEADKRPADVDDTQWQEYKTKWLPQLYQSIGIVDFSSGDKAKARQNLEKAASLDAKDVNNWLLIGQILDEDYQAIAVKVNSAGAGAERDALLKQANEKMDATIEVFARIVALTDGKPEAKPINNQVRESLEGYYTYRNKNTDGLQALIDKYKK